MQPDETIDNTDAPGTVTDDLVPLAQACVDSAAMLTTAKDAVRTAQAALELAVVERAQHLSDLANALGAAGITAPAFTFGGYTFTFGTGTATMQPTPPDLGALGGGP